MPLVSFVGRVIARDARLELTDTRARRRSTIGTRACAKLGWNAFGTVRIRHARCQYGILRALPDGEVRLGQSIRRDKEHSPLL